MGSSSLRPDRAEGVNALRGVVCLSVTALHFVYLLRPAGGWTDGFLLLRPGVESFFVLSGYFLAASYRERPTDVHFSVPRLVARRLLRLLVPFWVAVGLVYLLPAWRLVVPGGISYTPPAVVDLLANFACVWDLADRPLALFTFWSLATLIQLNVLWAAAFWLVRWAFLWHTDGRHHARTLVVLQALTLAGAAASWTVAFGTQAAATDWRLPHWFVYAALGSAAYWAVESARWRWIAASLAGGLLAGGWLNGTPRPVLAVASTAALVWLTVRPVRWNWFGWRAVSAVGRWSYSVYLVHGIVGYRTLTAVGRAGVPTDGGWAAVHFATAIGVSVAAGWVFFRLVELPVLKWSQGIRYRGV